MRLTDTCRTSAVWLLITKTIVVQSKSKCASGERFEAMALPSAKSLWEAKNAQDWMQEAFLTTRSLGTFGELCEAKQKRHDMIYAQRLDMWNATADNLGSLLNLAAIMA
jgi:hypothetical protein